VSLILTVGTKQSIWLVADRRLSLRSRPVKEDATKVMVLETRDGIAILGYAGLGATTRGTEPSDWMNKVLRGRGALTLEQALGVLADAMRQQLPRHLQIMPRGPAAHSLVASAFVGEERRLYTIDMALSPDRRTIAFGYTRHQFEYSPRKIGKAPPFARGGSGALAGLHAGWRREALRLVKANERGQISPRVVADALAQLNYETHRQDQFVGPNCIVIWRYRRDARVKWGGGYQAYVGTSPDGKGSGPPTLVSGLDMMAISKEFLGAFSKQIDEGGWEKAGSEMSKILQEAFAGQIGVKPDEGPFE